MRGFQLTFFTEQSHRHGHVALCEWLMQEAKSIGASGATLSPSTEGFGRDGKLRSAHFLETGDQPVEVTMALSQSQTEALFERLKREGIEIFYIKSAIEFGTTGRDDDD